MRASFVASGDSARRRRYTARVMLGLAVATDEAWVEAALADVDALLVDHAHCEMKAASNALSMAVRHGDRPDLVRAMTLLAEEELAHFRQVHERLVARGVPLGPPPVDAYAAELRKIAAGGKAIGVVERLLVGALIEARSCERFKLLSQRCPDAELRAFYAELLAAEAGHYRTFVDLAITEGSRDGIAESEVRARLVALAAAEGRIVERLARGDERAAIHG
jgi:tRNA 2-(methylsulfanyl)-N6-isopentenyladenosine37 hydroxylase